MRRCVCACVTSFARGNFKTILLFLFFFFVVVLLLNGTEYTQHIWTMPMRSEFFALIFFHFFFYSFISHSSFSGRSVIDELWIVTL